MYKTVDKPLYIFLDITWKITDRAKSLEFVFPAFKNGSIQKISAFGISWREKFDFLDTV